MVVTSIKFEYFSNDIYFATKMKYLIEFEDLAVFTIYPSCIHDIHEILNFSRRKLRIRFFLNKDGEYCDPDEK